MNSWAEDSFTAFYIGACADLARCVRSEHAKMEIIQSRRFRRCTMVLAGQRGIT